MNAQTTTPQTTPVIRTDAPQLRFISIIPCFLGKEDYLANLILERHERTLIRDYAVSMSLHPQGEDVMDKVKQMAASFRKLKALLKDKPVRLGILFQSIVGHGGLWANTPGGPAFRRVVNADGSNSIRPCPTGELFLQYVHDVIATVVAEGPDFTLTDDDLRMSNNACFCEEHLKLVSQRMGRTYTRETLVQELENAEPHSKISQVFENIQETTMNNVCRVVRKTLDEFDPHLSCGCCLVCDRLDYAEPQRAILKGDTDETFLRIGNGYYMEGAIKTMTAVQRRTGYSVVNLKNKGFDLLDESDTCPHNRFSKSARTMHLHIATGMLSGLDGCKLWFDQSAMPMHEISRNYEDIFGRHQGYYRTLHAIGKAWTPMGLTTPIPAPDREPFPHLGIEFNRTTDWMVNVFGQTGFPVFYERFDAEGIHLLAGKQPDYFTDDEIRSMLASKLILDGTAALALTKRGFARLMGVAAEEKPCAANTEANSDFTWSAAACDAPVFTAEPGAEVLTSNYCIAYKGAKRELCSPASVYFKNALGGQVIASCMNLEKAHPIRVINPARKVQYISWMQKLGGLPAFIPDMQDANLVCGKMPDGSLICSVTNYSYDPLDVKLDMQKLPKTAAILQPEGDFTAIPFTSNGIRVSIDKTLEPGTMAVLKFTF